MKKVETIIDEVTAAGPQSSPTLWELWKEYPRLIARVEARPKGGAVADLFTPFGGDVLRLLRSIPGCHWNRERKAWQVPGYSARRLAEVLNALSTRAR